MALGLANLQELRVQADAEIVAAPLPMVRGQESLLAQVFQNLVGNGIKFRRPGVSPRIEVSAQCGDGIVRVWVEDNGIGIDPKYAKCVFAPFRRLHGSGRYKGTGLGLAICAKIISRHGGEIGVECSVEGGSRFWFTLPLATDH